MSQETVYLAWALRLPRAHQETRCEGPTARVEGLEAVRALSLLRGQGQP
jgi:hypothetical protein